ncbi:MAG TPA: response regulator [Opitutaceae bacterium]
MNAPWYLLYAEDDENDAFFMVRAFAELGCPQSLLVVPTGRKAVDYLAGRDDYADRQRHPLPTAVMLDVKLPELSGLEVLAWIRARREFDALPVMMFTSSMQETDIAFCRQHGANAYMVKPSNAERLAVLVAAVMSRFRPLTPANRGLPLEGDMLWAGILR